MSNLVRILHQQVTFLNLSKLFKISAKPQNVGVQFIRSLVPNHLQGFALCGSLISTSSYIKRDRLKPISFHMGRGGLSCSPALNEIRVVCFINSV